MKVNGKDVFKRFRKRTHKSDNKLFLVRYVSRLITLTYLTTGKTKEEVKAREDEIQEKRIPEFYGVDVKEIKTVDGYEIILKKLDERR